MVHPPKPLDFLWISVEFVGFWVCTNYGSPTESIEFLMDLGAISYGFRWNSWVSGSVNLMAHPLEPLNFLWISVDFVGLGVCTHDGAPTETFEFLMDFGGICGLLGVYTPLFIHRRN